MDGVIQLLMLGLPVMMLCLLAGLISSVTVLVNEGRGRSFPMSRIFGWINLGWLGPLVLLSAAAPTSDVRLMFAFTAAVFALVGVMGLRLALRARAEVQHAPE